MLCSEFCVLIYQSPVEFRAVIASNRRLFFREQAERLTIGIVGGEASRPSTAQEADAVVAVTQDRDHARR